MRNIKEFASFLKFGLYWLYLNVGYDAPNVTELTGLRALSHLRRAILPFYFEWGEMIKPVGSGLAIAHLGLIFSSADTTRPDKNKRISITLAFFFFEVGVQFHI